MPTRSKAMVSVIAASLLCPATSGCGPKATKDAPSISSLEAPAPERQVRSASSAEIVRIGESIEFPAVTTGELSTDGTDLYLRSQIEIARRRAAYEKRRHGEIFDAMNGHRSFENVDIRQRMIEMRQEAPPEPDARVLETLRQRYERQTGDPYGGRRVIFSN